MKYLRDDVEYIPPEGSPGGLLIILDYPSKINWSRKVHLWGDESKLIYGTLKGLQNSLPIQLVYAIPTWIGQGIRPSWETLSANFDWIEKVVTESKPKKILCLGSASYAVLHRETKMPNIWKTRGFSEMITVGGHTSYVVYSIPPFYVTSKDPDNFRDLLADLGKVLYQDAPMPPPDVSLRVANSIDDVEIFLELLRHSPVVSCDLETTGLNPREDLIDAIGFGMKDDEGTEWAIVIPWELVYQPKVADLICDFVSGGTYGGTVVFHNAKFDLKFLTTYARKGVDPDFSFLDAPIADTMMMNYIVDERPVSHESLPHGLKALARCRYDQPNYKFSFDEFWSIPREERDYQSLYAYLGQDVIYTLRLYNELRDEISQESKTLFHPLQKLLHPAVKTFAEIELHGALLDIEYLDKLSLSLEDDLAPNLDRLRQILSESDRIEPSWIENFNPNSPLQVSTALYTVLEAAKVNGTSTDKETMLALSHLYKGDPIGEFCDLITKYREMSKALSTYVRGLMGLADENGRVHSEFNLNGTATGRLSSSKPNLQNQPILMGTLIREAFIAPEGFIFAEADFSQLELRIVGHLSQDDVIAQAYRDGRDIHIEVASAAFAVPYEEVTKDQRYAAKYLDFGIIYGRTAQAVADAPELVDYDWTVEQAQGFIDRFLGQFPGLQSWIERQHQNVIKRQYVETETGRRRRFPLVLNQTHVNSIQRQSVNTPIQSLASDFTLSALIELHRRLRDDYRSKIVSTVHDSILFEIAEDEVDEVCSLIHEVMTTHFPIPDCQVPIQVDIEIGPNWGNLELWHK